MVRKPRQLEADLSDFIWKRRKPLFPAQEQAATYFGVHRSRISRYENRECPDKPKKGFLAELIRCYVEKLAEDKQETQRRLLKEVNDFASLYHHERGQLFRDWKELCDEARNYMLPPPSPKPPLMGFPEYTTVWFPRPELKEITNKLVSPKCRLLTLYGPGGVGKTRLACKVARKLVDSRRLIVEHGALFVSCDTVSHPDNIISTIADRLVHFHEDVDDSKTPRKEQREEQLLGYLREKKLLLVLDSFEQLLADVGDSLIIITGILRAAPAVKILITSQAVLELENEFPYLVDVLDIPEIEPDTTLDDLREYGAVKFFEQRASQKWTAFSLEDEKDCVVRICQLVGGLPLAIEMVVAWLRTVSCNDIAQGIEKLGARSKFLISKSKDPAATPVAPRQKALQLTFEYSWELLSDTERDVLKRLSLFHGGCSLEAAEKVAQASLDILDALVNKSFLRCYAGQYRMLHSILRRSIEDKLEENPGDKEKIQECHSTYFSAFLGEREQPITGKRQKGVLHEIRANIENIQMAWNWAVDNNRVELVNQALESLYRFYNICSRFEEGANAFTRAVKCLREFISQSSYDSASEITLAKLLARQGAFCFSLGDYQQARELLQQSLEFVQRNGTPKEEVFCLSFLGEVDRVEGKYDDAERRYQKIQSIGDQEGIAYALYRWYGWIAEKRGNYDEARKCFQYSLQLYRKIENQDGIAHSLDRLALNAWYQGSYAESRECYEESLVHFNEIDDPLGQAKALGGLGLVAQAYGQLEKAKSYIKKSLDICIKIGRRFQIAARYKMLGEISLELQEYAAAKESLKKALERFQGLCSASETALSLIRLAEVECANTPNPACIQAARKEYLYEAFEAAKNSQDTVVALEFLRVYATLLVEEAKALPKSDPERQKKLKRGVATLVMVKNNHACWGFYKEKTGCYLDRLVNDKLLPSDVFASAQKWGCQDRNLNQLREIVVGLGTQDDFNSAQIEDKEGWE